jgi:hypothetical protein
LLMALPWAEAEAVLSKKLRATILRNRRIPLFKGSFGQLGHSLRAKSMSKKHCLTGTRKKARGRFVAAARINSSYPIVATYLATGALTPEFIPKSGPSIRVKATHLEGYSCQDWGLGCVGDMTAAVICINLVAHRAQLYPPHLYQSSNEHFLPSFAAGHYAACSVSKDRRRGDAGLAIFRMHKLLTVTGFWVALLGDRWFTS